MNRIFSYSLSFILFVIIFSSCSSSKRLKFTEAYKFQLPDRYSGKTVSDEKEKNDLQQLESINPNLSASNNPIDVVQPLIPSTISESNEMVAVISGNKSSAEVKEIKNYKKSNNEIKKSIKDNKKLNKNHKSAMSYLTKGLILTIGGLVLIIGGILLVDVSLILGSVVAGIGLIVFLIGFLGLIL